MSEEETKQEEIKQEETKVKDDFVLTDELRAEALKKPTFKILYISDGDTRLSPFRGESMIKTFSNFYAKQANIEYYTASTSILGNLNLDDLRNFNILWIDNVSDFRAAKNIADIQNQLMKTFEPEWKEKLSGFKDNQKEAVKYIDDLNKKRTSKLRIIYCLDEFIWEGTVGRSRDVQTVQLMETFIDMADSVIVPTPELKEAMLYYQFVQKNKNIYVIPSTVSVDFFPLFKNFTRKGKAEVSQLREKPKVLIKGLSVPKNIENFILENYKKMEITICSVDELNDHIMGLIERKKVNHIYHWANPSVNKTNIVPTYAIERDAGFDVVIHTKPDNLKGDMYEITTGDEDILFSISYGAVPICGIEHLGYEKGSKHLGLASGKIFGKDTPAKKISKMVENLQTPVLFNETFGKCRQQVEHRLSNSPFVLSKYFNVMLGKDVAKARSIISKEKQEELKQAQEKQQQTESRKTAKKIDSKRESDVKPDNVIEANFNRINN